MTQLTLKNPLVKDLAWLLEGHYIECDFDLSRYWRSDVAEQLSRLDAHPQALETAIAECKSHFLGSYFETLFSFAIHHLSDLVVHFDHLQIVSEGKTLGEVDMLVETPDGRLHQFEIAIKFYLERPDLFPHDWIGPNKNDSLLKKVSRARSHQLTILQTQAGQEAIESVSHGRELESHLLVFGRLYSSLSSPENVDEWLLQANRGGWIRVSNLALLMSHFSHYCELKKPHWLANPNINDNFSFNPLESAYNLVGEFLQDERPKHVFLKQALDLDDCIAQCTSRCVFIVPDSW